MIKLMQNLLGNKKVTQHIENGQAHMINWHYIEALNDIQENLGFSLANKLKMKHVLGTKHKMNVSLAAQTLSSSMVTAIDFLHVEANLPEFQGSEATTYFI